MMRWIIGTSLRLQFLVIILAVVLMFFGITQLQEMPLDVFPEFNPPLVEIQTEALGLSAIEMEALLTVPLEADLLNGVAWLDEIHSETVSGLSSILLVFEPGTDTIRARQMVQERLTQTFALPNVSSPPTMLQPLSTSSRVMMVSLSSADISLIDMSVLARWIIKPRLMGVPGVANVAIWGQREWQLQVQVDPERLHANGVTLQEIIATTGEAIWVSPLSYLQSSTPGTAGWIDTPNQRLGIQHLLPISAAEDLAQIPVAGHAGLLLGDVAIVIEDHQELIGDALLTEGSGLILVIEKFPDVNMIDVTHGVEDAVEALRPGLTGIDVDTTIFRPANYLELAVSNLSGIAIAAAVLAVVVLAAFYFGWRNLVVSLLAVPLSLVVATFVLYLRGASFNVMVLAGLVMALTIIVDDTIIDVENIARRLRQHDPEDAGKATVTIVNAIMEMRGSVWFAFLISILTILPIFFLEGLTASFLQPLVVSYVLAIFTSLMVALIVTPALSLVLLATAPRSSEEPLLVRAVRSRYKAALAGIINASTMAIGAAVVLVIVAGGSLLVLQQSLLPSLKQTEVRIQWDGAPSTSREAMLRITALVTDELQTISGISNVGSHIGRAITGDQVVGIHSGEIWVSIAPDANYDEALNAVEEVIQGYPGLFRTVETYQPDRLGQVFPTEDQEMVVRIYGHDLDVLSDLAQEISDSISGIEGIADVQPDFYVEEPQIEIEVNLSAAEQYQVKPGDVRRAATTLLSGLTVGNLYQENKVFEIIVWSEPHLRDSLSDIENLLIETPTGQVRLGDLADIRIVPSPIVIRRDAVQRYIDVDVSIDGRDAASVITDIESALTGITFPLEYHAVVRDDSQAQQSSQQFLLMVVATIAIGIFLLLQASFDSWRLALIAILTLPVALTGGVIAMLLSGSVVSLGSLFGLVAVLGIAVRNVLVTTNLMQARAQQTGTSFGSELVLDSAVERMIPIVITALTTGLAILPLVFVGNIAGTEFLHPMAVVILGGLVTTSALSLFILPAITLGFGASADSATSSSEEDNQASSETDS